VESCDREARAGDNHESGTYQYTENVEGRIMFARKFGESNTDRR